MKAIFDNLSQDMSKMTTRRYSTSFSLGIRFLNKELHRPIYSIYGFVRFADEIVDSFDGYDKEILLAEFKKDTYDAIEKGISLNPILNSFQWAVNKYRVPLDLIETFMNSMEMDLDKKVYDKDTYEKYILVFALMLSTVAGFYFYLKPIWIATIDKPENSVSKTVEEMK